MNVKKSMEAVEAFLSLADFLRDVKESIPKLENIPVEVKNLETQKTLLAEEVASLNKTRDNIKSEVEKEKEKEVQQINSTLRSVSEKESLLDSERTQIKNEQGRIDIRDKELTDMIASYEKATKEAQESKRKLDEKLKAIGEMAVA